MNKWELDNDNIIAYTVRIKYLFIVLIMNCIVTQIKFNIALSNFDKKYSYLIVNKLYFKTISSL